MIPSDLQIVFVTTSLFTFVYILGQIRKHKTNINDSIIWILWSVGLLIMSIFPKLAMSLATLLGFQSTSNFIIVVFIFFIYIIVFSQVNKISLLEEKNKQLAQKCSIYAYELEKEKLKGKE
ncbi:hypothetical protein EDD63_14112 [Breznakia blatticola]|uniref:DUF2304 domain-containing protein n=1 Tax=Breznakia blatticola TaxID=1754012 RepID=A0A4R7ZCR1_9FIRM|nr:DUF2304 domain-containing protein [Breznakia blatticola]TDW13951.1 hypothetical protein EDD63_14112 [Breznakia blatticola]